jgi:cyclohexa-1,5-dienecarbonyl-CoA hydratase
MTYELIKVDERLDGQVAEIILGPGPANIVAARLMEEVSTELERLQGPGAENRNRKLIIFSGEGKHFSYGASVEEHRPEQVRNMLPQFHRFIGKVLECRIPTLAKVSGLCLGGGFELALACSMIFCDETAKLGVPEIQLGVFPPPASVLLPFKAGDGACCEMVLTGETYSAADLHRLGIVNKVAPKGTLDEVVGKFIDEHFSKKSASSIRFACEASRIPIRDHYERYIGRVEKLYLEKLMSTSDAVEGIQSFLEKRPPKWADA